MTKHLVLAGGGHAHLTVLRELGDFVKGGHRVSLISPSRHHYYSGMGPGLLSGIYSRRTARFDIKAITEARGGAFIKDRLVRVDAGRRVLFLQSGAEMRYDVLSFNTGSGVPFDAEPMENLFTVKPVERLAQAKEEILRQLRRRHLKIIVAGGGPAGVEIAANLRRLVRLNGGRADIDMIAGSRLLSGHAPKARMLTLDALKSQNIRVLEGRRLADIGPGFVRLNTGISMAADFVFLALGVRPSEICKNSGLQTGPSGGLLMNRCLQAVNHPEIFGGGDCIDFAPEPLPKVGVYAVRQNPILRHNLMAALEGRELVPFKPQKRVMLILNLGDGTGLFMRGQRVFRNKAAFLLKDYIDRRFMADNYKDGV